MHSDHVSNLYEAASALKFMADKFSRDNMPGEAFLLNAIAETVEEGAGEYDELDTKLNRAAGEVKE